MTLLFSRPLTNAARVVNLPQIGAEKCPYAYNNVQGGDSWAQPHCASRSKTEASSTYARGVLR